MKRIKARAIVELKLSVPVPDEWGPESTVEQVRKQACESALMRLRALIEPRDIAFKGDPLVTMVLVEEEL